MGKNPISVFKTTINNIGDNTSKTYNELSKNVVDIATKIIPPNLVKNNEEMEKKPNIEHNNILNKVQEQIQNQVYEQKPKLQLSPLEKKIHSLYIGCFSDDPSNPTMEKDFGDISNIIECIELGKKNNYNYVGIQQGNKCYASNKIPNSLEVNKDDYCNIACDDINSGNCGGFFYNQVYKTDINDKALEILNENINKNINNEEKALNILEQFDILDKDINKINYGLSHVNYNCVSSINSFHLFIWIIVLIILLYLLFEYLYNKSEKII